MRYNKKIFFDEPISTSKLLAPVSKYFYINLLNGKVPTATELKKKWDSICSNYPQYMDAKKTVEGMGLIMKLLQWASNERITVLDVDTKYTIVVGDTALIGNIGTIVAKPNGTIELLITDFSSKIPDQIIVNMKLKYTLDAYAFKKTTNKSVHGIRVRNIKNAKDFLTYRTDDDFKRLEIAIKSVGTSIKQGLFYPRESIMCSTCAAKDYCKAWS